MFYLPFLYVSSAFALYTDCKIVKRICVCAAAVHVSYIILTWSTVSVYIHCFFFIVILLLMHMRRANKCAKTKCEYAMEENHVYSAKDRENQSSQAYEIFILYVYTCANCGRV